MKNIYERQKDILSIIQGLDISPTLYHNAVEKYQALGKYLNDSGLKAEIYPQGSFAFGTVVRPSAKDSSASYDLDFICQVMGSRNDYTPKELRDKVEIALKSNKTYADRLKIDDTCFTIEYADVGEIGFSIDVVPAADESDEVKATPHNGSTYHTKGPGHCPRRGSRFDHTVRAQRIKLPGAVCQPGSDSPARTVYSVLPPAFATHGTASFETEAAA